MHGVTLLLACCIAGGGILAARREVVTRRERDRQPQHALAGALQAEVLKLEALYDTHLQRLGGQLREIQPETEAARQVAQTIEGVERVSWLSGRPGGAEHHLHLLDPRSASLLPEPRFLRVMTAWMWVYGLVAQQMAWIFRPHFNATTCFMRPLQSGGSALESWFSMLFSALHRGG